MEIITKILLVLCFVALMFIAFGKTHNLIKNIRNIQMQRVLLSMLYAFMFVPSAYIKGINGIVGPFQLPTICGSLFYGHDYSFGMFGYGVFLPFVVGSLIIWAFMSIHGTRQTLQQETQ